MPQLLEPPQHDAIVAPGNGRAMHEWSFWFGNVYQVLKDVVAAGASVLAAFLVQHNANGTHSAITATTVAASGAVFEHGRAVAMGDFVDVPFNGANFSGSGGMGWTVTAGQIVHNMVKREGNSVTWLLRTNGGTTSGVAANTLTLVPPIPGANFLATGWGVTNGAAAWVVEAGASVVVLRADQALFPIGAVDVSIGITYRT